MFRIKNKKTFLVLYWILSFTWALPTTILGGLIGLILIITGHKPKKFAPGHWNFALSEDWGLELGLFAIVDKDRSPDLMAHEYGHHLQACFLLGPLTLFVATIPSAIRFWIMTWFPNSRIGKQDYIKDFWVEQDATNRGEWFCYKDLNHWRKETQNDNTK